MWPPVSVLPAAVDLCSGLALRLPVVMQPARAGLGQVPPPLAVGAPITAPNSRAQRAHPPRRVEHWLRRLVERRVASPGTRRASCTTNAAARLRRAQAGATGRGRGGHTVRTGCAAALVGVA